MDNEFEGGVETSSHKVAGYKWSCKLPSSLKVAGYLFQCATYIEEPTEEVT